jgi:hypothetical protein
MAEQMQLQLHCDWAAVGNNSAKDWGGAMRLLLCAVLCFLWVLIVFNLPPSLVSPTQREWHTSRRKACSRNSQQGRFW